MGKDNRVTKVSKLDIIIRIIVKIKNDEICALASQLAYYIVMSFFPLIIFLTSMLGFINFDISEVVSGMRNVLPESVFNLTETTVVEVLESQSISLLGGSIFIAIWMASSGVRAIMRGINKAYNIVECRSFIKRTFIAYISTILLGFIIIFTLAILVFGNIIGDYLIEVLPLGGVMYYLWYLIRYIFILILLITFFAALYKFTPCITLKWRQVVPGAIISTFSWVIVSLGFSFYINNFNNYSRFYGSLAAVFILMLWLFITSITIIIGAEINSALLPINDK